MIRSLSVLLLLIATASCSRGSQEEHSETEFRLGLVQKEIRQGMSQDAVAIALGSPNIVTQDKSQKETWIYDKIATEIQSSGASGFILFCPPGVFLPFGGTARSSSSKQSQRTLTVVIKFDAEKTVETVSYHASKF